MSVYKVNRLILHDNRKYLPGSTIEMSDRDASAMKNGQITLIEKEPEIDLEELENLTKPAEKTAKG